MADIIQLLPDNIANQIAAGEVIQRPASVVKELLENSIDAGSTNIKLIIKDAGKTLIQIIDNGCGMSATDARMAFERHATSKIRKSEDLFTIRTMGFRGEAMASIAAIAHVEMRTRLEKDELGTRLVLEGSEVKNQEPCQCAPGTNLSIKNLFYNVPARRKFLKATATELRNIIEEFQRVAIAHPDIEFSFHHNDMEQNRLPGGNLRKRLLGIFGNHINKKIVPLEESTDILKINGYIGKPEFAKRTKGEQMFFVNNRFIKSPYLHHAIMNAFEEFLQKDTYPFYVIFLEIDPANIDINVHPTKQEIKFDDEKLIYNYMKVAVRHALGQYSITPVLDFEQERAISSYPKEQKDVVSNFSKDKNKSSKTVSSEANMIKRTSAANDDNNLKNWQKLYDGLDAFDDKIDDTTGQHSSEFAEVTTIGSGMNEKPVLDDAGGTFSKEETHPHQIHNTYIVSHIKSGFLLVDQQAAHERILYERYLQNLKNKKSLTQKALFAQNIHTSPADTAILKNILPEIKILGFDVEEFGKDTFVIHGIPANMKPGTNEKQLIESLLEQFKTNIDMNLNTQENVARAMARSACTKKGQSLTTIEMKTLIDELFACDVPYKSPSGNNCFITYELDELKKKFTN